MDIVLQNTRVMFHRRGIKDEHISFHPDENRPRFEIKKHDDSCSLNNHTMCGCISITVFFIQKTKVNIQVFKTILAQSVSKHIVIVHAMSMTPDTIKSFNVSKHVNSPYFFESFTFEEMMFDPISIVDEHKLVNEKPNFWNKYPIILSTDIIARYYLFKNGDVIAIKENGYTTYRRCL